MNFGNFLNEFFAKFQNISGVRGTPPPDPLRGRQKPGTPRNFFLRTPLQRSHGRNPMNRSLGFCEQQMLAHLYGATGFGSFSDSTSRRVKSDIDSQLDK